jgi:hypothetical protein
VAFGHWYPPLISNDKLRLITFCAFFPSFISNTSIVSIHFGANLEAFPCFKFQTFSGGVWPHTRDHCYPPLISNDKLWLIFFLTFCAFFPSFISNTSIFSINFGANLDAQNAGNGISVLQISKIGLALSGKLLSLKLFAFASFHNIKRVLDYRVYKAKPLEISLWLTNVHTIRSYLKFPIV